MRIPVKVNIEARRLKALPSVQEQLDAIWALLPKNGPPGPPEAEAIRAQVEGLKNLFKPTK